MWHIFLQEGKEVYVPESSILKAEAQGDKYLVFTKTDTFQVDSEFFKKLIK